MAYNVVSTTRPEKCDFLHNIISLIQLLQLLKHAAEVYLTFRSNVEIFLSHNISNNIYNAAYLKNLSIKSDWSKNSADRDQTAHQGAILSGSTLFVI